MITYKGKWGRCYYCQNKATETIPAYIGGEACKIRVCKADAERLRG